MVTRHKFKIPFLMTLCLGLMLSVVPAHSKAPEFLIQADDVVRGDPKAPITLVEYSDFTCHFCKKWFHDTFPKLLSKYIETGKVRFVYRDFPRGFGLRGRYGEQKTETDGEKNRDCPNSCIDHGFVSDLSTVQLSHVCLNLSREE